MSQLNSLAETTPPQAAAPRGARWMQGWFEFGAWWLLVGMALAPVGAKVWNPGRPYHQSLLLLFVPPALWALWRSRDKLGALLRAAPESWGMLALLGWALITVGWANDGHLGDALVIALAISVFVFSWGLLIGERPARGRQLLLWAGYGFAGSALLALAAFPFRHLYWHDRVVAFGTLNNPNLAGYAMGAVLCWMLQLSSRGRWRWAHLAALLALAAFMLLTFSRAAWLALLISQIGVLLLSRKRHLRLRSAVLLGAAVLAIVLGGLKFMEQRGMSYRPQILEQALALIHAHPWRGLGMGSDYTIRVAGNVWEHSHNVFSHTAIILGLPGLLLWLLTWLGVGWRGWCHRHNHDGHLLLALWLYASVACMFDAPHLLAQPDVEWLLAWLPLACAVGLAWRASRRDGYLERASA